MSHSRSASDDSLDPDRALDNDHQHMLAETLGDEGLFRFRGAYERLWTEFQKTRANEQHLQEDEYDEVVNKLESELKEKSTAVRDAHRSIAALQQQVEAAEEDAAHYKTQVDIIKEEGDKKAAESRRLRNEVTALRKKDQQPPPIPPLGIDSLPSAAASSYSPRNIDRTTPRASQLLQQLKDVNDDRDKYLRQLQALRSRNEQLEASAAELRAMVKASKTQQVSTPELSSEPHNGERLDETLMRAESLECQEALEEQRAANRRSCQRSRSDARKFVCWSPWLRGWGDLFCCTGRSKCCGRETRCRSSCSPCCMRSSRRLDEGSAAQGSSDSAGTRPWYAVLFSPSEWFGAQGG
ncbi:unnamed protein product [Vitrella brassicaformis CCMP3155]|uniref:Uncharacterized protein n=1 Tax=Vitrella brassicaformis (strain CCMP3155) TaxID=1169540 RepID=A0A0G4GK81_VITBC|nr:unnamed protein product [Vitrella brassicaformis CCMP3155]|eukprot:CEM30321.1 unnamed protein product [Vitrella brassicaformis CCMP3155]